MIVCPTVEKDVIRGHYDLTTVFYRLFWGPHIHHGLWQGSESAPLAQRHLVETLAQQLGIAPGEKVLDVGCGMGGSSIHLARQLRCQVTGVTISPLQQRWARCAARWHRVARRTEFACADIEQLPLWPETYDVVWSIECTEHLFDKPRFFQRVADWLRPGGRVGICAWLAGDAAQSARGAAQVHDVCEGFFCPSLGTADDYRRWMTDGGLQLETYHDWTDRVTRTWEICAERVRRTGIRRLAAWVSSDTALFLDRFNTILQAYRSGAMRYGCFLAKRPKDLPNRDARQHRVSASGGTDDMAMAVGPPY